jgi:hypothetical protein
MRIMDTGLGHKQEAYLHRNPKKMNDEGHNKIQSCTQFREGYNPSMRIMDTGLGHKQEAYLHRNPKKMNIVCLLLIKIVDVPLLNFSLQYLFSAIQ